MTIGVQEVLEGLQSAVNKYGRDTTYASRDTAFNPNDSFASCRYVDPVSHEPLCIVGVALVEFLGVPATRFTEGPEYHQTNTRRILGLGAWGGPLTGYDITSSALEVLAKAQNVQDTHGTWGAALDTAIEFAASLAVGVR